MFKETRGKREEQNDLNIFCQVVVVLLAHRPLCRANHLKSKVDVTRRRADGALYTIPGTALHTTTLHSYGCSDTIEVLPCRALHALHALPNLHRFV